MMARVLLFLLPVGLILLFLIGPLLMILITSFAENSALVFPPRGFTLRWFLEIPQNFIDSTIVSIKVATVTTLIAIMLAVPAAVALMRTQLPGRSVLTAICMSPLMVPAIITGVALFQYLLILWDYFGLSLDETILLLVFGHLTFAVAFVLRGVISGYAQFDQSIEEAAANLGAAPIEAFFKVTLPVLKPGIVSGAVFAFFMSFDDVPIALFLGGANTTTLPVRILSTVEYSFGGEIMAISSIVIVASLFILFIVDRTIGIEKLFGTAR